eukprot:TRINITY_DN6656_c0_g1_i1.p1 TRINITY_DN6656_c0_g1~~TRINITY_DN6656_c0_g1_i1.p1  ORF type:complete len:440 (-),score=120.98 TRINITY_DN6656_c0_g1_i1:91-1410(-)
MTLSQFFVLSLRGDTIISRDYRAGDNAPKASAEKFFHHVKNTLGESPPIFMIDGVSYIFLKKNGLYFVFGTTQNVSPILSLSLLERYCKLFKDYCGVLSEEAIRKNFVLIYELLDETLDFGYPQGASTEVLKAFVYDKPVLVKEASGPTALQKLNWNVVNRKTIPSNATNKPITLDSGKERSKRNEIFVDLIERPTVLFSSSGVILRSEIDGSIQMKSYLKGTSELRLALNEDLVVGKAGGGYSRVMLDDINFHECVKLQDFETDRSVSFFPPDGDFCLLNYRISEDFSVPFRLFPFIEEMDAHRCDVVIKIQADIPDKTYGNNVCIRFSVPSYVQSASFEVAGSGQTAELKNDKTVEWRIKKLKAKTEVHLRTKLTVPATSVSTNIKKEIGPISMDFEIPMYNCSNVQIRYLRVCDSSIEPYRWIRYITKAKSYVTRV